MGLSPVEVAVLRDLRIEQQMLEREKMIPGISKEQQDKCWKRLEELEEKIDEMMDKALRDL